MNWFVLALAAGVASALNVWASKVLVTKQLNPVLVGAVVHLWAGLLCLTALPFSTLRAELSLPVVLGLVAMGLVYTAANSLYFSALKTAPIV